MSARWRPRVSSPASTSRLQLPIVATVVASRRGELARCLCSIWPGPQFGSSRSGSGDLRSA
eukprot:5840131-Lingulodinium_polyedra.AAC.1